MEKIKRPIMRWVIIVIIWLKCNILKIFDILILADIEKF
jgi:hypothetical protein